MNFQLIIGDETIVSTDTTSYYGEYIKALNLLTNAIEIKRKEYQAEIDRQHRLLVEEMGGSESYYLDWSSTNQAIESNNVMTEFRC